MQLKIRGINSNDIMWIKKLFIKRWGDDFIVSRGKIHRPEKLKGFIVEINHKKIGLITFKITNQELEITSIDSILEGKGFGTALVKRVINLAKRENLKRVWLITTNDNLNALRLWQKINLRRKKIYPSAIDRVSRKIKPGIPKIGADGIPIRDEVELEIKLR